MSIRTEVSSVPNGQYHTISVRAYYGLGGRTEPTVDVDVWFPQNSARVESVQKAGVVIDQAADGSWIVRWSNVKPAPSLVLEFDLEIHKGEKCVEVTAAAFRPERSGEGRREVSRTKPLRVCNEEQQGKEFKVSEKKPSSRC